MQGPGDRNILYKIQGAIGYRNKGDTGYRNRAIR